MGQTLSEPVIEKHTATGEDERLLWGVSEMQGWRLTMEDSHSHVLSLGPPIESGITSFFAVFDGHGGSTVAKFAGDTVSERLADLDLYKEGKFEKALTRAFLATDEDLRANPDFKGDPSGCTAVATIIDDHYRIICANAGDSRVVMSVNGEAKPLSYDHKPTNKGENTRIVSAGGFVEFGRVNGNLALSRALGDFEFKQSTTLDAEHQIVTADPDIIVHEHTAEDEFVVLACDGIWDVLTSQQVIDFVRRHIAQRLELHTICELLMDRCLAPDSDWGGVGCDNMTVLIVALKTEKRSKIDWYNWIGEKIENGDNGKAITGYKTPKELIDPFAAGGARGGSNDIPPLAEYGSGALKDEEDEVDENGVKSSTA